MHLGNVQVVKYSSSWICWKLKTKIIPENIVLDIMYLEAESLVQMGSWGYVIYLRQNEARVHATQGSWDSVCLGSRISGQQKPKTLQGEVVHSGCSQVEWLLLAERPDIHSLYQHSCSTGPGLRGCGAQWWVRASFPTVMFMTLPSILFHFTTPAMQASLSPQITKHDWEYCIFTGLQKQGNYELQKICNDSRRKRI